MNYNEEILDQLNNLKISLECLSDNINEFNDNLDGALNVYDNCSISCIKDKYDNLYSKISNLIEDLSYEEAKNLYINKNKYLYLNTKINNFVCYIDDLDISDLDEINRYNKIEIEFNNFIAILQTNNII